MKSLFPTIISVCLALTLFGCLAPLSENNENTTVATLMLTNPSKFERIDEASIYTFNDLGVSKKDGMQLTVLHQGLPVNYELIDQDNNGEADSILFLSNFYPAETKEFIFTKQKSEKQHNLKRTQAEVSIKTGGKWDGKSYIGGSFKNVSSLTPPSQYTDHSEYIRYEGPGLESDKVAYRFYLDWRNGFDIFGKIENHIQLHQVGQDGYKSYHEPAEWGMDILKVGKSPGLGGFGHWNGKNIEGIANVSQRSTQILSNGKYQSAIALNYKNWLFTNGETDLNAKLTMQAGSRLVHVELNSSNNIKAIGTTITKHKNAELIKGSMEISGHAWTYVATWGPQSVSKENLGLFLLLKKGFQSKLTEDKKNIINVLKMKGNKVDYYFGAAWSKEVGGITTKQEFETYLAQQAEKLSMPLRAQLRTKFSAQNTPKQLSSSNVQTINTRLIESEIKRLDGNLSLGGFDIYKGSPVKWAYTTGLLMQAFDDAGVAYKNNVFSKYAEKTIASYVTDNGDIKTFKAKNFNIDSINAGKMLLRLYERTSEERYLTAANHLMNQLKDHPRTSENAFWHKKVYPWQLWLDGVYMGMPFLAHSSALNNDRHGFDEAANEFHIVQKRLFDPETGLYFHGWDEKKVQPWADPTTGLSSEFWSRGMGWFAMALVDVLDYIPEQRADLRTPLIKMIQQFADTLIKYQGENGTWFQVTNKPNAIGNYPEASGSSMFTYMLAKAINKGYLDNNYQDKALFAYQGLLNQFAHISYDGSISVTNINRVSGLGWGRNGTYEYYMSEPIVSNDPKGLAPFIMAGIQIGQFPKIQ